MGFFFIIGHFLKFFFGSFFSNLKFMEFCYTKSYFFLMLDKLKIQMLSVLSINLTIHILHYSDTNYHDHVSNYKLLLLN